MDMERSVREQLYGRHLEVVPRRGGRRPAPRATHRTGRLAGGRYRLVERVGIGGMGTVYRAHDERLKRDVAVKVIAEHLACQPSFVRRFRREAELCARLAHPNIVAILDAGVEPRDFIVMEFVNGVDAGSLITGRGPLTPEHTVDVVAQVCKALAYAHDQDVLHVDVSPRNILLRRPGRTAKLADFGLASGAAEHRPAGRLGNVLGTPGYVAPEVLGGAAPSRRSDLYSLGAVAYRLLVGPSRSRARHALATVPQVTAPPRMPPLAEVRPDLPPRLIGAVGRSLARDPDARQGSVAEFHAQLVDALVPHGLVI
jgi:serine/threonine-protein kinase